MQDSKGYIWFFTERGVSKFNGKTFKNFTTKDGLSRNDVWNITEDSDGRLWLHTRNNEINYIRNDSVFTVPVEGEKVISIYSVSDWEGDVYFNEKYHRLPKGQDSIVTRNKRNYYDRINIKDFNHQPHFRGGLNKDTVIIRVENNAILVFEMDSLEVIKSMPDINAGRVSSGYEMVEYFQRNIFTVDEFINDLIIIDLEKNKTTEISFNSFFENPVKRVRFKNDRRNLQVQTDQGIIVIDQNLNLSSKEIESTFSKNDISRCLIDKNNNFWINTKNDGVYLLTNEVDQLYSDRFIISNDQIVDFHLIGNDLYACIESGKVKKYKISDSKLVKEISLGYTSTGFVEYANEFIVFNLGEKPTFLSKELALQETKSILPLSSSSLAIGLNDGIINKDISYLKSATYLMRYNSIENRFSYRKQITVKDLEFFNSKLFFSIKNKVFILEGTNEKEIFVLKSDIVGIKKNKDNIVLVTSEGGIFDYSKSELELLMNTGFECIDFCFQDNENILLLTSESIVKLNLVTKKSIKIIDLDYFSGSEFNKIKANNKFIGASSNDGIHILNFQELLKPKDPPQLNFLKSNSNEILISNGEELSYDNNNVSLDYDLISFNSLGRQTILFKLLRNKEVIAEYKEIETGKIELDNLKPGSYEVLVKGIDTYSNESPIQTFNFKIKKPYWQSIWFYFFIFFMSAFLFYMLSKIVVKRTEQKKEKEFKAKIKLAELELSALQSQLNPHFIFNAMGSIQGLIQGGEIDLADEYLAKFSRLMRHFLSSSKSKSNKLVHELEIIEDYINIEKLRYNNFDFHLEIDDKINVLGLDVPSLFIQPFIENSIAHGLFHKKGRGELKLLLKEEGEGMTVEIIDNGIGRAASKRINANSISNYKSYGMSLIKDRLTTLNSISSVPFRFNIVDLEVGTKVTLWIPYNNNLAA